MGMPRVPLHPAVGLSLTCSPVTSAPCRTDTIQRKTGLDTIVPVGLVTEGTPSFARILSASPLGLFMTIINEHDFPPLPSQEKNQRLVIERRAARRAPVSNYPATRASLNDLPDELILEILGYLPIDHFPIRFSTLSKLALTSRRLYRIVIGWLYERYDRRFCEPYLFLRTLVSNPQRAELVHDVHLYTTPRDAIALLNYNLGQYVPTAKDKKTIKEGLRAINTPSWKTRATQCNEDLDDDQVHQNTILLCTPNIKSISQKYHHEADLPTPKPEWVDIISKAAIGAFGGVHHFEYLRSIEVDTLLSVLSNFAPLFRMQSLRKIRLVGVAEYDLTAGTGGFDTDKHVRELQRLIPPACNNIDELVLDRCIYSEQCLDLLVKASRRLKTFKYSVDILPEWGDFDNEWNWDNLPMNRSKTIAKILRPHETSLETLHIYGDYRLSTVLSNRVHLYDDMTAFTSLKEISCSLGTILSEKDDKFAHRLPSSLATFRTPVRSFTQDHRRLGALKHMLANSKTYTPQLSQVRVVRSFMMEFDWKHFIDLSLEMGIEFVEEDGFVEPTIYPDTEDTEDTEDSEDSDSSYE